MFCAKLCLNHRADSVYGDVSRSAGTGAGAGGPVDIVGPVAESPWVSADDPAVSPSRLMVITLITASDTNEGTTTALCDNQSLDTDWPES